MNLEDEVLQIQQLEAELLRITLGHALHFKDPLRLQVAHLVLRGLSTQQLSQQKFEGPPRAVFPPGRLVNQLVKLLLASRLEQSDLLRDFDYLLLGERVFGGLAEDVLAEQDLLLVKNCLLPV